MKLSFVFLVITVFFSTVVDVSSTFLPSSSVALVSFTFCTLNVGVSGFFGIFRRRRAPAPAVVPPKVEEMSSGPNGPVFPFPQGPSGLFSNPFGFGGGLFPSIPRPQIFGNSFQRQSNQQNFQQQMAQQMTQQQIPQHMQDQVFQQMQQNPQSVADFEDFSRGRNEQESSPSLNPEEAESFFALLAETDESQCISRLVCEMGADPMNAGEFGQTITEIISNLRNFPPGSKVSHYNQILQVGVQRGLPACHSSFSSCDDESLQMVKNAQNADS